MTMATDPVLVFEQTMEKHDIVHHDYYQELLNEAMP